MDWIQVRVDLGIHDDVLVEAVPDGRDSDLLHGIPCGAERQPAEKFLAFRGVHVRRRLGPVVRRVQMRHEAVGPADGDARPIDGSAPRLLFEHFQQPCRISIRDGPLHFDGFRSLLPERCLPDDGICLRWAI